MVLSSSNRGGVGQVLFSVNHKLRPGSSLRGLSLRSREGNWLCSRRRQILNISTTKEMTQIVSCEQERICVTARILKASLSQQRALTKPCNTFRIYSEKSISYTWFPVKRGSYVACVCINQVNVLAWGNGDCAGDRVVADGGMFSPVWAWVLSPQRPQTCSPQSLSTRGMWLTSCIAS